MKKLTKQIVCEDCGCKETVKFWNHRSTRCKKCQGEIDRERNRLSYQKFHDKKRKEALKDHQLVNGNVPITHKLMICKMCGEEFVGRKNTQVFCAPCGKVNREEYLSKYNKSKWKKVLADPVLHAKNKLAGNKYRDKNKDAINKKKREVNSTPEGKAKQKVRIDRWNRNNPGVAAKRMAEWVKNNRERYNKSARERGKRQGYPHQRKHEVRKREALIKTSCDKSIKAIYKKCKAIIEETGIDHHVDHIIPLAIGGAHHQENLRIITAEENLSKHSKYDPSLGGVWADNDLAKKNRKLFSRNAERG